MKEIMNFSFISCKKGIGLKRYFVEEPVVLDSWFLSFLLIKIPGNFIINVKVVSIEIPEIVDVQPIYAFYWIDYLPLTKPI